MRKFFTNSMHVVAAMLTALLLLLTQEAMARQVCPYGDGGQTCPEVDVQQQRTESWQRGFDHGRAQGRKEGQDAEKFSRGVQKIIDNMGEIGRGPR